MLRRALAGLAFVVALAFAAIAPAAAQSGPVCDRFGEGTAGLSGWGPCPNAPNIAVDTSNANSIGGPSDYYLHLRDLSGASAACSSDRKYVGDWNAKMGGCGQFCFDFKVFVSGSPPGPITPSFTIWSGALSATFVANFTVTSSDPWRQNICAPINLIDPGQSLPSSGSGQWRIAPTGNAYSANWNTIIQNVTAVQLPIDWTSDPDEEAGYDNLCMSPGGCGKKPPPPVVTGCLSDAKVAVTCNPDGTYTLTLSGGGFTGTEITLASATAGVTVTPAQQPWAATTTWTLAGGTAGEAVTLEANATKIGGGSKPGTDECCSGEIKLTLPDCPKPIPVDVKIAKTEAKMPVGEPPGTHWFDLTVTNAGAAFTYPPGSITVTDNVPAGMTATSATGTGWTCTPATVTGPGALTCTYTPGGTLAAGASLPPILVKTKMTQPGTVENCAVVGLGAGSGLTDSDPSNNKSCIQVTTRQLCQPPMVPGPIPGECVCPTGTVLVNGECVPQTTCQPPMVPGPVAGECVCPPGEVLIGGACVVRQTACQPPMVPGPVPGECVCPTGTVLVRGQCVKEPACQPPLVPNAAGHCACPTGEVLRGRECVKEPACQPPLVPNAAGHCACPTGEVLRGRECVKEPACQPPLVPNAAGHCACPTGEVLRGRECVKEPTCQPPLVPNAAGRCACPTGEVLRGRECVKETACQPPFVPNAAGQCVCPTGEVAQGGTCVPRDRAQPGLPLPGFPQPGLPQPGFPQPEPNPREPATPQGQGQGKGIGR